MAAAPIGAVRVCNKCHVEKPATTEHFYSHKKGKYGLRTECRDCSKKIRDSLKEYHAAKGRAWRENNRERRRETERKRLADPETKKRRLAWYAAWAEKNLDRRRERNRAWRAANPDKVLKTSRRQRERSPESFREAVRRHYRKQMSSSVKYGIDQRISSRIRKSLTRQTFGRKWEAVVGYTLDELMRHLERQFSKGMSWDNRGEWEIDHIIPIASFGYQSVEDPAFKAAWALTNLRPLWRGDNRRKSKRIQSLL